MFCLHMLFTLARHKNRKFLKTNFSVIYHLHISLHFHLIFQPWTFPTRAFYPFYPYKNRRINIYRHFQPAQSSIETCSNYSAHHYKLRLPRLLFLILVLINLYLTVQSWKKSTKSQKLRINQSSTSGSCLLFIATIRLTTATKIQIYLFQCFLWPKKLSKTWEWLWRGGEADERSNLISRL